MPEGSEAPQAALDAASTFESVSQSPCSIDQLTVSPDHLQTRLLLVLREFKAAKQASTFDEVIHRVAQASENLEDLGVFRDIIVDYNAGVPSKPGTCNVAVELEERKRYAFNASTQVGIEGAVTAELTGRLRNLTGNCEHHSVTLSHGRPTISDTESEVTYRLRSPRVLGRPVHAQWSVYQLFQNAQADSSYTERQRGAGLDLISSDGTLRGGYELSWLQLYDGTRKQASHEVLADFGDHIKSAVHATYTRDRRHATENGASRVGSALRGRVQLAGLTPDANPLQFVQGRLDYQVARPLSEGVVLTVDAATGVVMPILGCLREKRGVMIQERFFLGGVSSLRGFAFKGVGPRAARRGLNAEASSSSGLGEGEASAQSVHSASSDADTQHESSKRGLFGRSSKSDALGGDLFATLRAAVNFALPHELLRQNGIQGHIFGDTGSITTLSGGADTAQRLDAFWNQWRLAVGLGIKIPFGMAGHLEANFVQPLSKFDGDLARPGFQLGFSSDPYLCVRPANM